ncbi:MAG: nucleotidyl transferase AbiEii/AbiGii toxin family protein [Pseudonocardiaceae bacterium]
MPLDPLHAKVLQIAAALPESRTVALAGGGAMLAHGIVNRVTKDVDLFTDRDAQEAVRIATALRAALLAANFRIEPAARPPHENRFVAVLRIVPPRWEAAGVGPEHAARIREVILDWRERLAR